MNELDIATVAAMRARGGSFIKALGDAASHADPDNLQKIKNDWPAERQRYAAVAEKTLSERKSRQ